MKKIIKTIKRNKLYWLLLLPVLYVFYYLNTSYPAMDEALKSLENTATVTVTEEGEWYKFEPAGTSGTDRIGLIFYPGGKVAPESYSPMLKQLAEQGYVCYLVKMPFNLAVFDPNRGTKIIAENPEIKHWTIGGHSLGGAMAAQFVKKNPDAAEGIFFLAAYPVKSTDLSQSAISSLSLYGEKDGLVLLEEIEKHRLLLPKNQTIQIIEGGNHGQFGWYGIQKDDKEAAVSREIQQMAVIKQLTNWLEQIGKQQ